MNMSVPTLTKKARRLPVACVALGLAAAVSAPAQVSARQQRPTPVEFSETFPNVEAGLPEICSFPIQIEVQGKEKTIERPNGTMIFISPTLTATVTNLETGEELNLRIPGAVKTQPTGELVFVGPNLVVRSPAFGDDTTGLFFVKGRFTFDPSRSPQFSGSGKLVDVCAVLA